MPRLEDPRGITNLNSGFRVENGNGASPPDEPTLCADSCGRLERELRFVIFPLFIFGRVQFGYNYIGAIFLGWVYKQERVKKRGFRPVKGWRQGVLEEIRVCQLPEGL